MGARNFYILLLLAIASSSFALFAGNDDMAIASENRSSFNKSLPTFPLTSNFNESRFCSLAKTNFNISLFYAYNQTYLREYCVCLSVERPIAYAIGIILTVGIGFSYLLQFFNLFRFKSAEGVSSFTFFLLSGSSTLTFTALILDERYNMKCCKHVSSIQCQAILLPLYQLGVSVVSVVPLYICILYYMHKPEERRNRMIGVILLAVLFVVLLIIHGVGWGVLWFALDSPGAVTDFCYGIGGVAAIAVVLYLAPQIWTTFSSKDPGALSIIMLLLQCPGAAIVVIFQAYYYRKSVAVWGPYAVQFVMTGVLLFLCLWYEWQKRRRAKEEEGQKLLGNLQGDDSGDDVRQLSLTFDRINE